MFESCRAHFRTENYLPEGLACLDRAMRFRRLLERKLPVDDGPDLPARGHPDQHLHRLP